MQSLKAFIATNWTPLPTLAKRILTALTAALAVVLVVVGTQSSGQTAASTDWLAGAGSGSGAGSGTAKAGANPGAGSSSSGSGSAQSVSSRFTVQVVGRVKNPGVYELPPTARVVDAIFAAGGFAQGADQASLNLARQINDGEQLVVGGIGDSSGQSASRLVNLNLSDAATLDGLPGIGPTLAARIVDYRKANGGFRSVSDLGKVSGIGVALLAKLKSLVTI
jgi:competence protein ComEA